MSHIAKNIALGALFLIPFIPLFVDTTLFFPYITGKGFMFRVLVEIAFFAWIALAVADVRYRPKWSWPMAFFAGLVVWMAIADAFGVNPHKAFWSNYERMDGWITLIHIFALAVVAGSILPVEKLFTHWWRVFLGAGAVVVAYGFGQLVDPYFANLASTHHSFFYAHVADFFKIHQSGTRLDASLGNSAYLAAYLLFVVPVALWHAFAPLEQVWSKVWKYRLMACSGLLAVVIFYIIVKDLNPNVFIDKTGMPSHTLLNGYRAFLALVALGSGIIFYLVAVGKRYTLTLLAVFGTIALFFTGTRGALVGAGVGTIVALLVYVFSKGVSASARRATIGALIAVLVLFGAFFALRNAEWVKKDQTLGRLSSISFHDLAVRGQIWNIAWQGFKENPVFGWGQEGFNQTFNTYYEPALYAQEEWFDRAHDIYLDALVAGGLPALVFLLGLLASLGWLILRSNDSPREHALLIFALVAYMVQSIVVFDNLLTYVPLVMLIAYVHTKHARTISALESASVPDQNQLTALVTPIIIVVAVVTIYFVNVPSYRAAEDLIRGLSQQEGGPADNLVFLQKALDDGSFGMQEIREQLTSFASNIVIQDQIPQETRLAFIKLAISEMQKEIATNPTDARLYIQLSYAYRTLGLYDDALALVREAEKLSPKKQHFLLEEGNVLLSAGHVAEARDAWKRAYELDTSFEGLAIYAAGGDIAVGNIVDGKKLLLERFGTTTVDADALIYAYFTAKDFDDMETLWRARIAGEPGNPAHRFGLAATFGLAGKLGEAEAELKAIEAQWPDQTERAEAVLKQMTAKKP